jgi:hypothetical protein
MGTMNSVWSAAQNEMAAALWLIGMDAKRWLPVWYVAKAVSPLILPPQCYGAQVGLALPPYSIKRRWRVHVCGPYKPTVRIFWGF